ncbi:hypothetical protein FLAN108750_13470 [Flavobacterium antarcticum]|uniref:hypothetical protein n=1 Tax=Flavobacterium antarcticum TaxID=271155 RepID=UPI0003B3D765|nr:hypothetical protein [Flavobacterium antarcticum]
MKNVNNNLKINLIGETWKLKQILLNADEKMFWLKTAEKLRKPLFEAIIDPFFYHYLNDKKIKSFEDTSGFNLEGLFNNNKNQIEIWYGGKKVQKLIMNELDNSLLLFPLFTVSVKDIPETLPASIYVEQMEIGLFGSFEIKRLNQFKIEDLEFKLINFQNKRILQNLIYENQLITCNKKDTLITSQNSFEI